MATGCSKDDIEIAATPKDKRLDEARKWFSALFSHDRLKKLAKGSRS